MPKTWNWNVFHSTMKYLKSIGFKMLPKLNNEYYMYKKSDFKALYSFSLEISDEVKIKSMDDLYIYGWAIEVSWKDRKDNWFNHWNHRIYNSKESAIDAVNQFEKQSDNHHFRIIPLYNFKNNGFRDYIISKIIQEEK